MFGESSQYVGANPCGRPVGQAQGRAPTPNLLRRYCLVIKKNTGPSNGRACVSVKQFYYRIGSEIFSEVT